MKNKPITARVKNKTMASPSKMKGYTMKSSPFKQVNYEVIDGKLVASKTTTETTPAVAGTNGSTSYKSKTIGDAPGGDQATDLKKYMEGLYKRFGDDVTTDELVKRKFIGEGGRSAYDSITDGKNKGVATVTPATDGKEAETKTFKQEAQPMRKVVGEASTAYESRNNLRRIKQAARKEKRATIKEGRLKEKLISAEGAKKRRIQAKIKQAKANKLAAGGEVTSGQAQIAQGKTGFGTNKSYRLKDVNKTPGDVIDDATLVAGSEKKEVETPLEMNKPGFFKKKSPMKMNYFKK